MVDEQIILASERLRDDLVDLRSLLRKRYPVRAKQVTADDVRTRAAQLAEVWLVQVATDGETASAIGSATIADLSIHFQRILTFAEHATTRSKYEAELRAVLDRYTVSVLLPLKQSRGRHVAVTSTSEARRQTVHSAFIGQSFAAGDARVNQCVLQALEALGVKAVTGERPKADAISEKVKRMIDEHSIFVGIFTRRDKIAGRKEWTTSAWVIDEKAYAVGRRKPLVLLKEQGVGSIGGIQGDYEFLEFTQDALESLIVRLVMLFELINSGLRK